MGVGSSAATVPAASRRCFLDTSLASFLPLFVLAVHALTFFGGLAGRPCFFLAAVAVSYSSMVVAVFDVGRQCCGFLAISGLIRDKDGGGAVFKSKSSKIDKSYLDRPGMKMEFI